MIVRIAKQSKYLFNELSAGARENAWNTIQRGTCASPTVACASQNADVRSARASLAQNDAIGFLDGDELLFAASMTPVGRGAAALDVPVGTGHWATRAATYGYDVSAISCAIVADVRAMASNLTNGAWFFGRVEVGGTTFRYSAMPAADSVRVTTVYSPGKW